MQVGNTQSQALFASLDLSRTAVRTQEGSFKKTEATLKIFASQGDVVEVGGNVDADFAARVLRDSLEEKFNTALEEAGIEGGLEGVLQSGMDFSPEATAQRIVEFATGFFSRFRENHQGEEGEAQLQGFVHLIRGAIEAGFAQARDILSGLGEMAAGIQEGIDRTFKLTMEGLDAFAEEEHQRLQEGEKEEAAAL